MDLGQRHRGPTKACPASSSFCSKPFTALHFHQVLIFNQPLLWLWSLFKPTSQKHNLRKEILFSELHFPSQFPTTVFFVCPVQSPSCGRATEGSRPPPQLFMPTRLGSQPLPTASPPHAMSSSAVLSLTPQGSLPSVLAWELPEGRAWPCSEIAICRWDFYDLTLTRSAGCVMPQHTLTGSLFSCKGLA